MTTVNRRTVLAMGGAAALGAAAGGLGVGWVMRDRTGTDATPTTTQRSTFQRWRASRAAPYYIAHRGAGDVAPEHTIPSYQAALGWGAEAIEISVVMSADRELFCMHDLTLDRTTTLKGPASSQPASVLESAQVRVPRLGPRWAGPAMPALPRLRDVLAAVGGRAVLCIEAKDDSAFPLMLDAIKAAGLQDTVMIKVSAESGRLATAKEEKFPVFAYLGNVEVASAANIEKLARTLDPSRDCLVLPCRDDNDLFSAKLVRQAVNTSIPTWVFPVHRRHEVTYFRNLGVEGFVTPDLGYLTGSEPKRQADLWSAGAIAAGELTRDPYSNAYALTFAPAEASLGLDFDGRPSFVTFGNIGPITATSYRLAFDAMFEQLPEDNYQHLSVAFGHVDDRYYEHRIGDADGLHTILRADGEMAIFSHDAGSRFGKPISRSARSTPLRAGVWARLSLDVTPETIRWSRDDGTFVQSSNRRFRGGYVHIGRSSEDGPLRLRNLSIA